MDELPAIEAAVRQALEGFPAIRAAYLFGSAAKGGLRAGSDIDLAVLLGAEGAGADLDVRLALGRALEPRLRRRVDVVVLDRAPLALRYSVYRAGRAVLERDPGAARLFKARSLSLWFDFEPAHARTCRAAIAVAREGEARG